MSTAAPKAKARAPILLVDDRRENLDALEAVLESPEYEIVSVTSGMQALDQFERREFAVILLDVQMPGIDGIETASRLRERAARLGRRAPIIFVTAIDAQRERVLRAYESGGVDFMEKPLEPAVLTAKVAVFADLYRARMDTVWYRLLVDSVEDYAIFILDPKGYVTTWNTGARRTKGYSAEEIIGKHFSIFYPAEDVSAGKCEHELDVAIKVGRFEDEDWRIRKDGSRFWANVVITAMRSESGDLVGFAKVTRDLTHRVRNEEQLRNLAAENAALEARSALERKLRVQRDFLAKAGAALAASLDYRTTLATVARLAVPELADSCSIELEEPGNEALSEVTLTHADPNDVEHARELAQRPPDPIAPAPDSTIVVPLTGRHRVFGALTFVYTDSGRRYTEGDRAFAEDFARRAAMAIENAQAHATLASVLEFQERFVGILGHDLRNPLSAIDMGAGLLRQRAEAANDPATTRVLDRMKRSSRRMSRMIEQILDLTRSRLAGGLQMQFAETDLCATLTVIVDELCAAHPNRTVELRCPGSLVGRWDRDRLEQVFSNLIGNALSYGLAEKPVVVDAREEAPDGLVRVTVHNEGPPISEELQAKIFAPFRRGELDSKATQTQGLGLGLYISHAIVTAHRGEIEVRSKSAEGTTFLVTLPRRPSTVPS